MTLDDTTAERLAELRAYVDAMPLAAKKAARVPYDGPTISDLDHLEAQLRASDPTGLPARCEDPSCRRRLPMISRSDRWHPKCGEPR